MKNKKNKFYSVLFAASFAITFFSINGAQAALKSIGSSCQKGAECKSGKCGESFTCEGTVAQGGECAIGDDTKTCWPGYYCQGDTFTCTFDNRASNPTAPTTSAGTSGSVSNPAATNFGNGTSFTNPLRFSTVDQFISQILGVLQGIIVTLSLVVIVYGAVLYVTSAGGKQIETAKNAITSALVGLAIGIAAPSFLKEIAGILGWGTTDTRLAGALSLTQIATNVLNFFLGTLGILSLIMLVYGAIMYLTSAGDSGQVETGKKIFRYALIGVFLAMASMVLVTQVAKLFVAA